MVQKLLKLVSGMDLVDSMASSNFHRSILFTLDLSRRPLVLASKSKKANLPSSLSAPRLGPWRSRRNELIYILATPLLSALLLGAGERKHMCARAAVCRAGERASVWRCVGVGRTRKARPQRFKDSTPGAAGGNLNRNVLEQVLIRGLERIPNRRSLRFSAAGIASAPLNRQ